MSISLPARSTFWRFILGSSAMLLFLSVFQVMGRAKDLGVDLAASRAWAGLAGGLSLMGLLMLVFLALTWSRWREQILSLAESAEHGPKTFHWIGALLLGAALIGFSAVSSIPVWAKLFAGISGMRLLLFWLLSLLGMWGIKVLRRETPWFIALVAAMLCQTTLHLLLLYWQRVTDYPFAMGWSETSRFYYPSLFLSKQVYGQDYPWPILHPTLHLLLALPYLFDAPLWFHRFWQVALRYVLVGAVVPVLLKRVSTPGTAARWLIGLWIFLFLFMGPVYFHLTIPVILMLLGFSAENERRTWVVVLLASIWCGWSRVNWYPMPGIIAAVLYLMEVPYRGQNAFTYLWKPAVWFLAGTLTAFLSQRIYIALSGIPNSDVFYTSFTSDLLWYRLWPNASFALGILPGAVWVSLPVWLASFVWLRAHKGEWHPLRLTLIVAALGVVFLGGIVVSLKIGGGANLHNMDGYFILLLIFFAHLFFGRYQTENGSRPQPRSLHWLLVLALLYSPVSTYLQFGIGSVHYDSAAMQNVLASLQERVDSVNSQGGEILFITQRHLLSMGMLDGVTLVPEYEREDLMEVAMADNLPYLETFRRDMEEQRFALIVVDPLNDRILARRRAFAEENNVWVTQIVRSILCNYREDTVFPAVEIALYVPQEGPRQCP